MPAYNRLSQDQYFSSVFSEERTERSYMEDPSTCQWEEVHILQYEGCDSIDEMEVIVGYAALGIARSYGGGDGPHCDVRPDFYRRYIKSVFGVSVPVAPIHGYPAYGQVIPEWMDWLLRFVDSDSGDVVSFESTTEPEWYRFEAMFNIVLDALDALDE
jgi:hypothetical protein